MSVELTAKTSAFGVEAGQPTYRLRQARYYELAVDVATFASKRFNATGRKTRLVDVGVYNGLSRRYIEVHPGAEHIEWHGVDIFPQGYKLVYKHRDWTLHDYDLEGGLPGLESNHFDVVLCEQVLEHLHNPQVALADLGRVLAPGGLLIVGVPIFPDGVHLVRKHVVPLCDRLLNKQEPRGHVQAFSKRTFVQMMRGACEADIQKARGFRILSGGVLRPLEYCRWWWRLNRSIGSVIPSLCTEVQIVASKSRPSRAADLPAIAGKITPAPALQTPRRRAA